MKRYYFSLMLIILSITIISWGVVGHKTVATIAYNHLSPKAKDMVKELLGDTTMADVASWADQVLREPAYKKTAPQHYINAPLGLSYEAFKSEVLSQQQDNVYKAVLSNGEILSDPNHSKAEKAIALKFIIHFIGDLHQPMHVSRAEDKGGNTIQLQYEGNGTNLHSLWDGKLIGTEGKDFTQMSIDYDKATSKQVKQWQSEPLMKWLYESYEISSKLYLEIEQNNKLSDDYYRSHINIVRERIEMAGVRLASMVNQIANGKRN